jgi:hypothetical protein
VTTRARDDIDGILRARLRDVLPGATNCMIYLRRLEPPVFKLPPTQPNVIAQRMTEAVTTGQHTSVTFPEVALTADVMPARASGRR